MKAVIAAILLALATFAPAQAEEGVTLDRSVARAFAAMIVEVIPEDTAWAAVKDGSLDIMDDSGKVLLQGAITVGSWDGAMALLSKRYYVLLGRIINGMPLLGGDNTWPTTYYKGRLTTVADDKQYPDGATSEWFKSLMVQIPNGPVASCCDQSDCRQTKAIWQDGGWWAESRIYKGEWVRVPLGNVQNVPNPLENAIICEAYGGRQEFLIATVPSGKPDFVYCFVPQPQSF